MLALPRSNRTLSWELRCGREPLALLTVPQRVTARQQALDAVSLPLHYERPHAGSRTHRCPSRRTDAAVTLII